MASVTLVLHVASVVCFALAALRIPTARVEMIGAGLFLWFLPIVVAV